jgi:hypothetical protein
MFSNNRSQDAYLRGYNDMAKAEIARMSLFRADAQTGVFAQHLVMTTLAEVFRHENEKLKFVNDGLISWDTSVPAGALQVGWQELLHTDGPDDGIVADDAEDIGAIELQGEFHVNRAVTLAKSFKYSVQDVETAQVQGSWSMVAEKSEACRDGHDRDVNNLVRNGSADGSIPGLYRYPGILVEPAITGNWAAATAAQIEADFNAAVTGQRLATAGVEEADTALFPIVAWQRIKTLRSSTATDITVLEFLKRNNPEITRWEFENGLVGKADTGSVTGDSCLIYRNSPSVVRGVMPLRLVPMPPQERGLVVKVIMRSRYAGLIVPKPRAIVRLDGI